MRERTRVAAAGIVLTLLPVLSEADAQEFTIGIVDVYGLRRVSSSQVEDALSFKEGDTILMGNDGPPPVLTESESRLSRLPGVTRARINPVCCDRGRVIIFVGIEEQGAPTLRFRAAPTGHARLADDIVQSGKEFFEALMPAIQRGDSGEDHSQGHALNHDPATRAVQERFVTYAKRDLRQCVPVEPFIEFLNSPVWSDRNKSSGALLALSAKRDPRLLAAVRKKALASLVEMARFKSGHAYAAFIILARIAGYPDEIAERLLDRGEREVVIKAAVARR